MNINSINLSGRLTSDSELRFSQTGTSICNFRLAVSDRQSKTTMFINVVCFGKQADALAEYLVKGRLVGVTGRLKIEDYEKDGIKRNSVSVIANDIQLGPKAADKDQNSQSENEYNDGAPF